MAENKVKMEMKKVSYFFMRVYNQKQRQEATASVDFIYRKQGQVNIHLNFYESGKFPFYQKKNLIKSMDYTVRFPAWVIKALYNDLKSAGCSFKKVKTKIKRKEFGLGFVEGEIDDTTPQQQEEN